MILPGLVLLDRDHDGREAAELGDGDDVLALGLHADRVLVGAGHHVDGAADQRLQRLRAAAEIVDLDVEPLLLEEALPLGDGQRQVVEQRLAADAERQSRLLLGRLRATARGQRHGSRAAAVRSEMYGVSSPCRRSCRLTVLRRFSARASRPLRPPDQEPVLDQRDDARR